MMTCRLFLVIALICGPLTSLVHAQQPAGTLKPRRLAPGVLTTITPPVDEAEASSGPRQLVDITKGFDPAVLNWKPNLYPESDTIKYQGERVVVRHKVWYLEFSFKPLRMLYVDIPQPTGRMQRKPIWYMAYKVKNLGYHLDHKKGHYQIEDEGGRKLVKWNNEADKFGFTTENVQRVNHSVRFFPTFVLESHEFRKRYMDQLIPIAVPQIQRREDRAIKLHDSVSISTVDIPVSTDRVDKSVWGVVTWTDIDPKIDFFSIYVKGLTNAYKFAEVDSAFKTGSPPLTGRRFQNKVLQLNFWRPGDQVREHEREIHFGLPPEDIRFIKRDDLKAKGKDKPASNFLELYGVPERVDYHWLWE